MKLLIYCRGNTTSLLTISRPRNDNREANCLPRYMWERGEKKADIKTQS